MKHYLRTKQHDICTNSQPINIFFYSHYHYYHGTWLYQVPYLILPIPWIRACFIAIRARRSSPAVLFCPITRNSVRPLAVSTEFYGRSYLSSVFFCSRRFVRYSIKTYRYTLNNIIIPDRTVAIVARPSTGRRRVPIASYWYMCMTCAYCLLLYNTRRQVFIIFFLNLVYLLLK